MQRALEFEGTAPASCPSDLLLGARCHVCWYPVPMAIPEVRALIPDLASGAGQIFTDGEITTYLSLFSGNSLRAAATALLAISTNEALLKKMHTDDLGFDGPAGADAIRKNAMVLLAEADRQDAGLADSAFIIAYPEFQNAFDLAQEGLPLWPYLEV